MHKSKPVITTAEASQPIAFITIAAKKIGGTRSDADALWSQLGRIFAKHGFELYHLSTSASKGSAPPPEGV